MSDTSGVKRPFPRAPSGLVTWNQMPTRNWPRQASKPTSKPPKHTPTVDKLVVEPRNLSENNRSNGNNNFYQTESTKIVARTAPMTDVPNSSYCLPSTPQIYGSFPQRNVINRPETCPPRRRSLLRSGKSALPARLGTSHAHERCLTQPAIDPYMCTYTETESGKVKMVGSICIPTQFTTETLDIDEPSKLSKDDFNPESSENTHYKSSSYPPLDVHNGFNNHSTLPDHSTMQSLFMNQDVHIPWRLRSTTNRIYIGSTTTSIKAQARPATTFANSDADLEHRTVLVKPRSASCFRTNKFLVFNRSANLYNRSRPCSRVEDRRCFTRQEHVRRSNHFANHYESIDPDDQHLQYDGWKSQHKSSISDFNAPCQECCLCENNMTEMKLQ